MCQIELSDEQWQRVEGLLPGQPGSPGRSGDNNRLFLEAVLWIVRTGAPWRDLPERSVTGTASFNGSIAGRKGESGSGPSTHFRSPI